MSVSWCCDCSAPVHKITLDSIQTHFSLCTTYKCSYLFNSQHENYQIINYSRIENELYFYFPKSVTVKDGLNASHLFNILLFVLESTEFHFRSLSLSPLLCIYLVIYLCMKVKFVWFSFILGIWKTSIGFVRKLRVCFLSSAMFIDSP